MTACIPERHDWARIRRWMDEEGQRCCERRSGRDGWDRLQTRGGGEVISLSLSPTPAEAVVIALSSGLG